MFEKDNKTYYDWIDYRYDIQQVKNFEFDHVVGIYRGSLPMAVHISNVFDVPMSIVGFQTRDGKDTEPYMIKTGKAPTQILVVDDIYDSGYTMKSVIQFLSHYSTDRIQGFCLFGKENKLNVSYANEHDGSWIVFPWETLDESV
jgi:hypoxanthine phosphoribosyltransferase|tara:strand:- start:77 stop:508 length:432 start_codon:yes stop_codon:yes gene_type:complete